MYSALPTATIRPSLIPMLACTISCGETTIPSRTNKSRLMRSLLSSGNLLQRIGYKEFFRGETPMGKSLLVGVAGGCLQRRSIGRQSIRPEVLTQTGDGFLDGLSDPGQSDTKDSLRLQPGIPGLFRFLESP